MAGRSTHPHGDLEGLAVQQRISAQPQFLQQRVQRLHRIHRPQQAQQIGQRVAVGVAVLDQIVSLNADGSDRWATASFSSRRRGRR